MLLVVKLMGLVARVEGLSWESADGGCLAVRFHSFPRPEKFKVRGVAFIPRGLEYEHQTILAFDQAHLNLYNPQPPPPPPLSDALYTRTPVLNLPSRGFSAQARCSTQWSMPRCSRYLGMIPSRKTVKMPLAMDPPEP